MKIKIFCDSADFKTIKKLNNSYFRKFLKNNQNSNFKI